MDFSKELIKVAKELKADSFNKFIKIDGESFFKEVVAQIDDLWSNVRKVESVSIKNNDAIVKYDNGDILRIFSNFIINNQSEIVFNMNVENKTTKKFEQTKQVYNVAKLDPSYLASAVYIFCS